MLSLFNLIRSGRGILSSQYFNGTLRIYANLGNAANAIDGLTGLT
ncbi:hypothetical protein SAMN04487944_11842 [Gracilibacillus ureilyticus]|uniref:Uncharacterized protein n=1 Tax=Gracilibacillus ureilyticus TaxID=531814 RepID=A0A1H9UME6_9BACI|nr:hypothetical protein [Gracilibacillus ureilyticus]SES10307.1 hypothetical protein SAMN04487944_11842 [Gracilibacillus ureilyticus]